MDKNNKKKRQKKGITVIELAGLGLGVAAVSGLAYYITKNKNTATKAAKLVKDKCMVGFMEDLNAYPPKGEDYVNFMKFMTEAKTCPNLNTGFGGITGKASEFGKLGTLLVENDDEINADTMVYLIYKSVTKRGENG